MIVRIWHGFTTPENADKYEKLLYEEVWKSIEGKNIKGYRGIELLKREHTEEVEFITIMRFDGINDVKEFAGENYTQAYVPSKAQHLLKRFDSHSQHYERLTEINYQ
ncbi:MAG: antibiotic biosynthesis monooxygenase [Bacillota bacterium]